MCCFGHEVAISGFLHPVCTLALIWVWTKLETIRGTQKEDCIFYLSLLLALYPGLAISSSICFIFHPIYVPFILYQSDPQAKYNNITTGLCLLTCFIYLMDLFNRIKLMDAVLVTLIGPRKQSITQDFEG